jgi:hypothetical protein
MPQLTNQESRGFTHFFRITGTELATTGYLTSSEKVIASLPSGGIVTNAAVVVNSPITGASNIEISVGTVTGTATNMIAAATDLDALTKVAFNTGTVLVNTAAGYVANNTASATPIFARFAGTVANITGGDITIALTILDPGAISTGV